ASPFRRNARSGAALLILLAAAATTTRAADWPQYRGPEGSGVTSEKISSTWPDGGPRQLWKAPLNSGFSSFAVAGDRAFTLVTRNLEGVNREACLGLDANTGRELWAAPLAVSKYDGGGDSGASGNDGGDGPRSTPAADASRVYTLSSQLVLFCLDAQDGRVVWKHDLVKEYGGRNIGWQNAASPLVEGNLIFVCGGGDGQSLLCFHKGTGGLVWKGQSERLTHASPIATTLLGHRQIIFFTQSGLVSVVPGTGQVLWRYAFPYRTSTAASAVASGDIVFCSAGYGVGAGAVRVSKEGTTWKATELWRKPGGLMNHWSTSVAHNGYLYGLFGFKQWERVPLKCVELATGEEKWSHDGYGQGGVVLAGETLVALAENGDLVLVEANPTAYHETARTKAVTGKCWNNPAVANGRIYARSTKEGVCLSVSGQVTSAH
ncbi:MAG TPA: PQQ-binding-like beta-propeller repeat protein, partial [Candidatus Saccharimonadales bacterium]|nr:PQQ-binding-like beta-propeller repeat protein [Candidatus Saccharimonadales bacterium]